MENITIALVTDDSRYGRALSRGLQHCNRGFVIDIFGRDRFLERWAEEGEAFRDAFDLILWDGEEAEGSGCDGMVRLTEHSAEGDMQIGKYLPAGAFTAEIFRAYEACTGRLPAGRRSAEISLIAFSSFQGGAGCSTIAMAVGQELAGFFGRRVLYLSLDEVEATGEFMDCPGEVGRIGEYLYRLFHGRQEGLPYLDRFLVRDGYGLQAIPPSNGRNPLRDLSRGEMERVMAALMESGQFDAILIDAGTCCCDAGIAALRMADRVCSIVRHAQPRREAAYNSCMRSELGDEWETGRIRVRNCVRPEQLQQEGRKAGPAAKEASDAAIVMKAAVSNEILLEGEFAKNIHALTEQLWYNQNKRSARM